MGATLREAVDLEEIYFFKHNNHGFILIDSETHTPISLGDCPNSRPVQWRADGPYIILTAPKMEKSFIVGKEEALFSSLDGGTYWEVRSDVGGWLSQVLNRVVTLIRVDFSCNKNSE